MKSREERRLHRLRKRERQMERFAPPARERCSSCGSDGLVEHHRVGAIEAPVALCRPCAATASARPAPLAQPVPAEPAPSPAAHPPQASAAPVGTEPAPAGYGLRPILPAQRPTSP